MNRTFLRVFVLAGLFLCGGLCSVGWMQRSLAQAPNPPSSEQEDQRKLRRVVYWQNRMKLLKVKRQENQILDEIEGLDQRSVVLFERVKIMQKRMVKLQGIVAKAKEELDEQNQLARKVLLKIRPRLQMVYRLARLGKARLLLGTRSLRDMASRWRALEALSVRDIRMLRRYQSMRREAEAIKKSWVKRQNRLLKLMKNIAKEREQLSFQRREKAAALKALYRDKELYRRTLRSLRGSGRYIQSMVTQAQGASAVGGLALQKGELTWPIQAFSPYCESYELKSSGSFQRLICQKDNLLPTSLSDPLGRSGIVLRVPEGTAVLAVAKGTVAATGFKRGYGQLVIVDHGNQYYTIYAHLSQVLVKKGEEVNVRYPVGLSGSTGTLGPPQLYFEMRQGVRTLNPQLWLKSISK
ncbi:MAG: hypothetical protein EP343_16610 [Deltaproteobacteria bacterium]|nr:MAG: hypothetical protein EP343_16610 [Deltaproteobacteria bacterium]